MSDLLYLKKPENMQKLNALFHLYDFYKDAVHIYLNDPTNRLNNDLNIFYIREFVPAIDRLVKELRLNSGKIRLPSNYILSTSLFVMEKTLQNRKIDPKDGRIETFYVYGKLKELVESVGAVNQEPIPEINDVIYNAQKLISLITRRDRESTKEKSLVEDFTVGPLKYSKKGGIFYNDEHLKIRSQLISLCILFMENHKYPVDYLTIKEELISAKKRSTIDSNTIKKYVSELHLLLMKPFGRDVIFNHGKEAYIFDIEKKSKK